MLTQTQSPSTINLLLKESETLYKLSKFKHPNLQKLVTWFRNPDGAIIIVIEFREGKSLSQFVEELTTDG